MLQVDPTQRPDISDIIDRLQAIAAVSRVNLKETLQIGDVTVTPSQGATRLTKCRANIAQ